jgi:hypothetical protein
MLVGSELRASGPFDPPDGGVETEAVEVTAPTAKLLPRLTPFWSVVTSKKEGLEPLRGIHVVLLQ